MKRTILLALLASAGLGAASQTFTGVVTDSMCGKDHAAMNISPETKCVRECAKAGAKYALYDGKQVYTLSDQKSPAPFAGQKVVVTGTLTGKTSVIKIEKIEAAQ